MLVSLQSDNIENSEERIHLLFLRLSWFNP